MPGFVVGSIYLMSSFFLADGQSIARELSREGMQHLPFIFIILHAFTFLLTMYFNKLVPFKVLVASTVVNLITAAIAAGLFFMIFGYLFTDGISRGVSIDVTMTREGKDFFEHSLLPKLIVSYFKMKEKEA